MELTVARTGVIFAWMKRAVPILLIILGLAMVAFGGKNCWDAMFQHVVAGLAPDPASMLPWLICNATIVVCGWMTLLGGVLAVNAKNADR